MNSEMRAARWITFLAARVDFPLGTALMQAFEAGRITRLCDCGCNSFDFQVPDGTVVEPLAATGGGGAVFELNFHLDGSDASLELIVFVDKRGHFEGVDVQLNGNSSPAPDDLVVVEPPYHIHISKVLRR